MYTGNNDKSSFGCPDGSFTHYRKCRALHASKCAAWDLLSPRYHLHMGGLVPMIILTLAGHNWTPVAAINIFRAFAAANMFRAAAKRRRQSTECDLSAFSNSLMVNGKRNLQRNLSARVVGMVGLVSIGNRFEPFRGSPIASHSVTEYF